MTSGIDFSLEDLGTWPVETRALWESHQGLVLKYLQERRRIDQAAEGNVMFRILRPPNAYEEQYQALVKRMESTLEPNRLVAYHCTRLTPREVETIRSSGLRVLSTELVRQRVNNAVADGHLTEVEGTYLLQSPQIIDNLCDRVGRRAGLVWLSPNPSVLVDPSSVYRLFRSWGGEGIYVGHEQDERIASKLARTGTPAIVKCSLPYSKHGPFVPPLAARMLSLASAPKFENPEPSPTFDLPIARDLLAAEVLDVITFVDSRFDKLTSHAAWPIDYQVRS